MRGCLLLILLAGVADAAPVDQARSLAEEGRQAFAAGRFEEALDRYEYTLLLSESPTVAFNIAACLERLGRFREAAAAFTRYADLAPQKRESVRARIDENTRRAGAKPSTVADESKRGVAAARYAFENKDHATAVSELLRAYALAPSPALALHLADVLEAGGEYARAAMVLDRYVELGEEAELEAAQLERARARADAIRYRKTPVATAPSEPPAAPASSPPRRARDDEGITVALHGSANNDDKQRRCIAAVKRAGYQLDLAPRITAVLTLGKENRLRIVDRERGVLRDEIVPRWGMEPLCVEAARIATSTLDATR
jgi:tetratricopeptide (TPR) repeat protein